MKFRNGFPGFILAFTLLLVGLLHTAANAQNYTYRVLHDFFGGLDGDSPFSQLVRDNNGVLYGTTTNYDTSSYSFGTVFRYGFFGNDVETLHRFSGPDGAFPYGGLVLDANGFLYGTTA